MLHPQMQSMLDAIRASAAPPMRETPVAVLRARAAHGRTSLPPGPDLFLVEDVMLPLEGRTLPMRRYVPSADEPAAVVVYFHSGGWTVGDLDGADALARHLALLSGCEYLSVDYRLAPEHPFPAAADDAQAALEYAVGTGRTVVLHGDSSGGNLAAGAALWARDEGIDIALQVLVYPVTDHDFTRPSYTERADHGLLAAADMRWFWDLYAPAPLDRSDPRLSPVRGELAGVAPAVIVTAEFDPLRDEGRALAAAMTRAGVDVTVHHADDAFHGFFALQGQLDRAGDYADLVAAAIVGALADRAG